MENKGEKKSSSRNDISLDQAILQWIVDDYDISDEKSRKIVGKSGEKSKLITRKMVMNYLDNRGVLEETDETEFMRSLRKRLYYAIDTVVGPIPMKSKSINAHELLRQKSQSKGRFYVTSANAEFFMYLLWCNEDRADNDDILWLIKNERNYEASEWLKNLIRDGFDSLIENPAIGIKQKTVERRWKELFEGELAKTKDALESLNLTWAYIEDRKKMAGDEFDEEWFDLIVGCCWKKCIINVWLQAVEAGVLDDSREKSVIPTSLEDEIAIIRRECSVNCTNDIVKLLDERISEWKLDLMAAKVFEHLTFDKGKTVKEVYRILNRCMAEEKTVRISRKAMLEKSIAKQRERLDKYIDLCADGIITKQELMERRKGLDNQIADLQSQYESVEQEDERSGALDMNLISQKLDEWQRASKNDVDRELINSCVAQITPLTNEEFRWVLDFQMSEVQARNAAAYTMDGFVEMARFSISFEEAKAFKASRNQGIRKNEWQDLTVVVGIWSKTQN